MKELGGYFELERFCGKEFYDNLLRFNYCRTAMRYLIQAKKIRRIAMPYYICDSLINAVKKEDVEILFYSIADNFLPESDLMVDENTTVLVVNYFGFITEMQIKSLISKYPNVILDNTHAFFSPPLKGVDTLYSCRKFFGVADGGYLSTDSGLIYNFPQDHSAQRMFFLLGRLEDTASTHYQEYRKVEDMIAEEEIKSMSKSTQRILSGIDYEAVKRIRTQNYRMLDDLIGEYNLLKNMPCPIGPYGYPFLVKSTHSAKLRARLQENHIYVPILWSNVRDLVALNSIERNYVDNIILLPIDQRYNTDDMEYLANIIKRGAEIYG